MKALDYILKGMENRISYDEHGNISIDTENLQYCISDKLDIIDAKFDVNNDTAFISKELYDRYSQYEIILPEGDDYTEGVRKPYFRMRGKPVTEEQAFDIIRRTDIFLSNINAISKHKNYIHSCNFYNRLFNKNCYPLYNGWICTNGTVGMNGITGKYPNLYEFIGEWLKNLCAFPYLDLVIAITNWNETSPEVWKTILTDEYNEKSYQFEIEEENFCNAVTIGIYVHDKVLEILTPADAVRKYKEYVSLYGENKEIFVPKYYQKRGIERVSLSYMKKCIESYGLDADEELSKIPAYEWKNEK